LLSPPGKSATYFNSAQLKSKNPDEFADNVFNLFVIMDAFCEKESEMAEAATSGWKTFLGWVGQNVVAPIVTAKVGAVASEIQADGAKWDANAAAARAEAANVAAAGSSAVSPSIINTVLIGAGVAGLLAAIAIKTFGGRRK